MFSALFLNISFTFSFVTNILNSMQNLQNSNENTVEELKNKIIELNTIIEINKQQEKEGKKSKKKKSSLDDGILETKLDSIMDRIDNIKGVIFKSELEKVKNQMLTEMDLKFDAVQEEFRGKMKTTKRKSTKCTKRINNDNSRTTERRDGAHGCTPQISRHRP